LGLASAAHAQAASDASAAGVSASEYASALMDLDCPTCEGKVENLRGFSLATPGAARASAAKTPARAAAHSATAKAGDSKAAETQHVSAADLRLNFQRGSAELTPDGEANARNFALALKDPRLSGQDFLIIGHTDATGSAEVNLRLSEARAEAVKAFLVSQGIAADRLQAKGVGSQDLAVPSDPRAGANRRVEIQRAG
jgi:outer membrane protein OmpA-like peptidoglycan-associated protein